MVKIDIPSKRLLQLRPGDWVKAILREDDILIAEMKPDKTLK